MEFDYAFETTRGDGIYGWVKSVGQPEQLSYVGNSGVKFGGAEAAILDVKSYVNIAGGLTYFEPAPNGAGNISATGMVPAPSPGVHTETLTRLLAGIEYWTNSPDEIVGLPVPATTAPRWYPGLVLNHGLINSRMKIDASPNSLTIYVNNVKAHENTAEPLTAMSTLELQSHWGSGAIFENVSIKPK